jgi:hypothetical protein
MGKYLFIRGWGYICTVFGETTCCGFIGGRYSGVTEVRIDSLD